MLRIQKFLETRYLEDLEGEPFNLIINYKNDLVVLKYNQIKSDFSMNVVKECRGLILNKNTFEIVCNPFDKFFNFGESFAFNIDLEKSIILEKVDGALIKIYYYNNEWKIATNGTIDASDAELSNGITFDKLFFDIIPEEEFKKITSKFDISRTYLFELVHPAAQIVVDYKGKKELVFIGMKENQVGEKIVDYNIFYSSIKKEYEKIFKNTPIRFPKIFDLSKDININDLVELADEYNKEGNESEGFVVCQIDENKIVGRVKVKSPKYLTLHRVATGEGVTNNLINVLIENEMEEFEVYVGKLPESVKNEYEELKVKYLKLIEYLSTKGEYYKEKATKITRKELALDIQERVTPSCIGIIFTLIDKDINIIDLLKELGLKKVKRILLSG